MSAISMTDLSNAIERAQVFGVTLNHKPARLCPSGRGVAKVVAEDGEAAVFGVSAFLHVMRKCQGAFLTRDRMIREGRVL